MFRLWLRELFPAATRLAPKSIARGVRPQLLSLEDRVNPAPLVSISDATLVEGNAGPSAMTFTVTLDVADKTGITTVDFATADGTATVADSDYVALTGTVILIPGQTTQTFTVSINGDTKVEADETFSVTLSNASSNASIAKAAGTGTITNDDKTTLTLTASAAAMTEGAAITYTVTSSNAVQAGFGVAVSATPNAPATAADITLSGTTLTFTGTAGEPQSFTVGAVADGIVEPTETFAVALGTVTPTNALIPTADFVAAGSPVTGTITDADIAVLTVADATAPENAGPITFTVTSSKEVQGNFSVDYATANGTAIASKNYTASSGTLNFAGGLPAGQSKTFTVPLLVDNVVTGNLTFQVKLSNPVNAAGIPAAQFDVTSKATGTVTNTDTSIASISVSAPTVVEGGNLAFVFTLSNAVDMDTTFQFDGVDVTTTAGADYTAIFAQSVTILANTTSKTVTVATVDDRRVEGTETFSAVISNLVPNGRPVTLDPTPRIATITDNDTAAVTLDKTAEFFPENNQATTFNAVLTITATGVGTIGLDRPVDVAFALGGTATVGPAGTGVGVGNYAIVLPRTPVAAPAGVSFAPPGVTFPAADGAVRTAPVTLTVFENLTDSGNLTATVTLGIASAPPGGQVSVGAAGTYTLTIVNDDNPVRTYDATDAGDYRLVRNGPNVELYFGTTRVAVDVYGTAPILFNGSPGKDSLQIDYSNGNPVPAGGVTFDGKGGTDQLTALNGDFASITSALTSPNSGTLTFVGLNPAFNGVVTYTNLETQTLLDPASVLVVNFTLPAAGSVARLGEDKAIAGNGRVELVSDNGSFLATRFVVPSVQLNVDRGNASDTLLVTTAGNSASDLGSSIRVGTPAAPFAALTLAGPGPLTLTGSADFNAQTIALNAPLTAVVGVTLVSSTGTTQTAAGTVTTAALRLGVGGAGNYTLTSANNAATLAVNTTGNVAYRDVNALTLAGVTVSGTFALEVGGALTQTAPVVVTGATTVTAGLNPVTLTNPGNDFSTIRVVSGGNVALTDANAVVLDGVNASGDFALVTANGAVTQSAPVVAPAGTTTVTTGTGNVTLTDPANDFGTLNLPQAGTVAVRDINGLVLAGASVAALDAQFATGLSVTGNVTAAAAAVALRGGNLVRVNAGLVVRAATTVAISLDNTGGTVDLRGADLVATSSTVTGGTGTDLFQLTGTTTPVTVDGKAPTGTPTGDRLDFDAQGKNVAATPNSFNTAGAAVTYLDIETVRLLNPAAVTLDGTNGDDRLTIARAPGGPLTYRLNSDVPVEAAGTTRFRFNGLAGSDALIADFKPGDPVPAGGVIFDGGAGADLGLGLLGAGDIATYTTTPTGPALSGRVTVGNSVIEFVNLETTSQVDLTNFSVVTVGFATADDVLTVSNGFDATAGKVTPALIVSGPATPRVGLWNNVNLTLTTAGNDGNDTVTVASADAKHANTNVTLLTGGGNDAVAVMGNVAVDGTLRIQSQAVSVGPVSVTTGGGNLRVENAKTLTLTGSTVSAGGSFTQADGGPVALTNAVTVTARGGDLSFSGAVNGPGSLAANTAGVTRFAQSVGQLVPLLNLATDAGGRTDFAGPVVQTSNSQSYGDPVTFAQSGTAFRGTAGTINFLDTLDPAAAGLDFAVGGPGVDVTFAKAVGSKAAVGTLLVTDTRNLTANGAITAATLRQDNGTGTTTLNGPVTLTNDFTVVNAKNVTLNGPVTATTFRQAAGSGVTTLNGPLTASSGAAVVGATSGGAINIVTNTAVLAGAISAPNAPIVLTLAGGATQPGGQFTTKKLYLNNAGPYQLDRPGNALTDGKAELFVNVSKGKVSVRDSTDLFVRFEDSSKAAISIGGAGDDVTLTTGGNFVAEDPRAQPLTKENGQAVAPTSLVPLVAIGGGTLRVRFAVGRPSSDSASLQFVAEVKAAAVILGQDAATPGTDRAFDNVTKDRFVVRPALGAPVTVNGNLPVVASGENFRPFDTLLPQLVGLTSATLVSQGEGNGTFTFPGTGFQPLVFTSIETFEGRNVEAFAVQTAPRLGSPLSSAYSIRLSQSQNVAGETVRIASQLDGSGILPNPFVVSPSLISPAVSYSAPRLSLADVDGDGRPDLIIANGAGDAPAVTIIDGRALVSGAPVNLATLASNPENLLAQFFPFDENFRGGLSVATGDFDGDGRLEIVVGAGVGGGPRVQVFKIDSRPTSTSATVDGKVVLTALNAVNADGKLVAIAYQNVTPYRPDSFNFFAFESSQRGGVNVAVGDFNGDGTPDIVVGAGVGGGPRVRILSGKNGVGRDPITGEFDPVINDFFAYDPNFRGGVFVDAGRYDAGVTDDLVTAPGAGGGPHVKVFLGSGTRAGLVTPEVVGFMAYDLPLRGLVNLTNGEPSQTGVGGVAFGASLDPTGLGGRRSILVTSPRGSDFNIIRFDSPEVATTVPTKENDLKKSDYQQILASADGKVPTPTINVAALGSPAELLAFDLLRAGGSAAGFSVPPGKA